MENVVALLVYCGILKAYWLGSLTQNRSLEDIFGIFEEENIERYTELASRAFKLNSEIQKKLTKKLEINRLHTDRIHLLGVNACRTSLLTPRQSSATL